MQFYSIYLYFLGLYIYSISESEVGQELSPLLTLYIKTQLGERVREDMTFRVNDKVTFHLYLDNSGER